MKKINSIGYGHMILVWGLILVLPIPLLFYLIYNIFNRPAIIMTCLQISAGIGVLLLFSLVILLVVELKQDKRIDRLYCMEKRFTKVRISDHCYECQNCGNRSVREVDASCPVCGNRFLK